MRPLTLACAIAACACNGNVGTIAVKLTTAPNSTILDNAETLQVTITNPRKVTTVTRTSNGFDFAVDLSASGDTSQIVIDALDGSGAELATGASPTFPLGAITAEIVIYMAAPNSVGEAPVTMSPARSRIGGGTLSYGAVFAGGVDATGAPTTSIQIYNAYDHQLVDGLALPAPRAGLALGVGASAALYLFGGSDANGAPTSHLWRFDTSVAPSGAFTDYGAHSGLERSDARAVPLGNDVYLVTGTPAADLDGTSGSVAARTDIAGLPAVGATVLASDSVLTSMFADATGVQRLRAGAFDQPAIAGALRTGHELIGVPGGAFLIVCGGAATPDAIRIDALTLAVQTFPGVPSVPRAACAIAETSRHVVIAGGDTGSGVSGAVDVYDASSLALVTTAQLVVPRKGAVAIALPNDQVLIAGGVDGTGAPVATLELFTPAAPAAPGT